MFISSVTSSIRLRLLVPRLFYAHTKTCPSGIRKDKSISGTKLSAAAKGGAAGGCPCPPGGGGAASSSPAKLTRAMQSGPVRLGFLPDEWFTFFYNKTGVTGPYLFFFNLANYMVSKEIFIMEHEYYLGLSALLVIVYVTKNFGKDIGASLDKEVDAVADDFEKGRKQDLADHEENIKIAKHAQLCAEGQKLLMDAKKENVAMQLEAVLRERSMLVYYLVRGRMDYYIKKTQALNRIHQKWMIGWILKSVRASITPEFEKQALDSAIQQLSAAASAAK